MTTSSPTWNNTRIQVTLRGKQYITTLKGLYKVGRTGLYVTINVDGNMILGTGVAYSDWHDMIIRKEHEDIEQIIKEYLELL